MDRKHAWILGILILAVCTLALAGESKCTASTQDCLNKMAAKLAARGWVGLELEENEKTGGLTVNRVVPYSPATEAGFREGDVLLALNGVGFAEENHEALKEIKQDMKPGTEVTYTVARKGKERDLDVTLTELPEDLLAQWIGNHMIEHATYAKAQY